MKKSPKTRHAHRITPMAIVGLVLLGVLFVVLYYAATRPTSLSSRAQLSCPERCEQKICGSMKEDKKAACVDVCQEILCGFIKTCDQKCESNVACSKLEGEKKTACISQCKQNKCKASFGDVKDIRACELRCETKTCKEVREANRPACVSRCKAGCRK